MPRDRLKHLMHTAASRLVAILFLAVCSQAGAVEIRLRPQANCPAGVVRLHDLAELLGDADAVRQLGETELLPAPLPGQEKRLSARELCDLLELRGIDTAAHTLSGAGQVAIANGAATDRRAVRSRRGTPPTRRQLETAVAQAVKKHLERMAAGETLGEIRPQLSDAAQLRLAAAHGALTASGGKAPWTGNQEFTLSTTDGAVQTTVAVEVLPARVAVALRRPLNRGAVIGPADVELAPQHTTARLDDAFENLDDVVGKELLQGSVAGQVLRRNVLRAPLLVKQGQPVTVYSRAAGIQIRTVGMAKDDGSQGELVAVESPQTKQRYFARVVGMQEVEVWATATSVSSATANVAAAPAPSAGGVR